MKVVDLHTALEKTTEAAHTNYVSVERPLRASLPALYDAEVDHLQKRDPFFQNAVCLLTESTARIIRKYLKFHRQMISTLLVFAVALPKLAVFD